MNGLVNCSLWQIFRYVIIMLWSLHTANIGGWQLVYVTTSTSSSYKHLPSKVAKSEIYGASSRRTGDSPTLKTLKQGGNEFRLARQLLCRDQML